MNSKASEAGTKRICFAHPAYQLASEYGSRVGTGNIQEARTLAELQAALPNTDILVASGLWRNEFADLAPNLRFIQSVSAGTDQFSRDLLRERGIRLASAQGVNERAVAEHALALLLGLTRHLGRARDDQRERRWRGMIGDRGQRQDELSGKTMLIVGLGRIGARLARLAQALDMRVVGVRRSPKRPDDAVEEIIRPDQLLAALPQADAVALTCPLTPETERLIRREHLRAMKPTAFLINVARGRVVDKAALVEALAEGEIAGAGLDCFVEEPLPPGSPLWGFDQVMLTPHVAGETRRYEESVIDLLIENLRRLDSGEPLRNAVV